jgi:mRNA-degrading endonuclease toxin of MazEF toxin-antitoxin module
MLRRGDVIEVAQPPIGFAREGPMRIALVVQADPANDALPTTVIVPLDDHFDPRDLHPFDIVMPAKEAGSSRDHVAHAHLLQRVFQDRLGRLRAAAGAATMTRIDAALSLLLGVR